MNLLLAADIGASKTDLGIFSLKEPAPSPLFQDRLINNNFSRPEELLAQFISTSGYQPSLACLAIAGLIGDGQTEMTNRHWQLDGQKLTATLGLSHIKLINDLTALSASLLHLHADNLITLQKGMPIAHSQQQIRAVIAPGTGLGQGFFIDAPPFSLAQGTEGGHASFAPCNDLQYRLLRWLQHKDLPISVEQVCSGRSLPTLYQFCLTQGATTNSALQQEIKQSTDQTPLIIQGALTTCPCCRQAVELFLEILGAEAGNLALKLACNHGLFLGGGILPRLHGQISFAPLLAAFQNKAKMSNYLKSIPVHLIMKQDAALMGAAVWARQHLQ
ncbi:MAG: glucokinase [Desulfobulbaceae bacterium]|uniref:Glucokinase n=1 Tax=Candidatus Desulfatifera sulfidica TaxID=2841691 RepID=A0A8J6T9Z8_9BACT|nr:glucokinase [Candidatus Desulfatifera sulfidica]